MTIDPDKIHKDLNRFRTLSPLDSLDDAGIAKLTNTAVIDTLNEGDVIFQPGDYDVNLVYVLLGEIEISGKESRIRINARDQAALRPLAHLQPRQHRAVAKAPNTVIARINEKQLDQLLTMHRYANTVELEEELPGPDALDSEWMMAMLRSPLFRRLPANIIHQLFSSMEEIDAHAGDTIIRQGESGDYYYLIKRGRCEVKRSSGSTAAKLAEIEAPGTFGEEALISDAPRNATVTMLSDGVLMRLSRDTFRELMGARVLHWVGLEEADALVRNGAIRLDVRSAEDHAKSKLRNSLNIPHFMLRVKLSALDRKYHYLLFCDDGSLSAASGFIMHQQGFRVSVLRGGLNAVLSRTD